MSVNTAYIKDKGGNKIVIFKQSSLLAVTTTGTSLVSGTDFLDIGEIASSTHSISPSTTEFKSEDGIVRASDTTYSGKTTAVPMQTSKEIIDALAYTFRDVKLIQYCYHGYKASKTQESFASGYIESGFNIASPGGASSMNYSFVYNAPVTSTEVVLTTIMLQVMRNAIDSTANDKPYVTAAVTIPRDQEILFKETT